MSRLLSAQLQPLRDLPGVAEAVSAAVAGVDAALRQPGLSGYVAALAVEAGLRDAVASAALEGHSYDLEEVRAGTVTDPVLQGALRVSAATGTAAARWSSSPRQVLARLHVLAARDCPGLAESDLGRPVGSATELARLNALCELISSPAEGTPSVLRAAVVHGELLALGVFGGANGVLARAAGRLTLIAGGLDPRALLPLGPAHVEREIEYIGCANAFRTGTPDGVRAWLRHCANVVELAAGHLQELADRVGTSPSPA